MLTLAVCDDDEADLKKISEILNEWTAVQPNLEFDIRLYSSPFALLDAVSHGRHIDIFLLDILMPEMTGITLGEKIQTYILEPLIIFLTSSEDYYPDAYRLYAFQYVCKPLHKTELLDVLDRAFSRCDKQRHSVFTMKTSNGLIQIPLHTIVYVELLSHICHFHLNDNTTIQSQYLRIGFDKFIGPLLKHKRFVKTHTAFIVNLSFVGKLTPSSLTLTTGEQIPVTRTFSDMVQRSYMEYALRDGDEHFNF